MMSTVPVVSAAPAFQDAIGHHYQSSIEFLHARDIVQGFPDGSFGPDRGITRAEMLKIILGATEAKIGTRTDCFTDVKDERYANFVCYAKDKDIIKGYGDGSFKPDAQVTIAEGLKMALGSFNADVEEGYGHRRYEPFVDFVHDNNMFSKFAIYPWAIMLRGQMAYLVHQLVLEKEGHIKFTWVRSNPTLGCENTPPKNVPTSSDVGWVQRNYITVLPKNYDKNKTYPLIIAFHGRTNPNTMVRSYYKIEREADGEAFIVYPAGLPEEWPTRNRSSPGDKTTELRDFALFDTIVQDFSNNYCIDADEIYVVGHSLGAWFTNTLACARGDVIRGIGSVWGSITKNTCTGPVATMIMHNPKDNLAWFGGGLVARDHLLEANGCWPATVAYDSPEDGHCVEYTDCLDSAPVVWCEHSQDYDRDQYYPHVRPTFAGKMIWEFLTGLR